MRVAPRLSPPLSRLSRARVRLSLPLRRVCARTRQPCLCVAVYELGACLLRIAAKYNEPGAVIKALLPTLPGRGQDEEGEGALWRGGALCLFSLLTCVCVAVCGIELRSASL